MEKVFLVENGLGMIVFASELESDRDTYFKNIKEKEKWSGWYIKTEKNVNLLEIAHNAAKKLNDLELYAIKARG